MANPTIYQQSVPIFIKFLKAMDGLLDKGEAFCKEKGIPEEELLTHRLYDDMKPLPFQVQAVSNTPKNFVKRVGLVETEVWEDDETTFAQLHARVKKTIDLLASIDPKSFAGKENEPLLMKTGYGEFTFDTVQTYTSEFAVANFHFHLSTAYCILRNKGVPVGAMDYLKDVFTKAEDQKKE